MVAFLSVGLLVVLGCSGSKSVDVQVTLDGKPLSGAAVTLVGDTGGPPISGGTDSNGMASLTAPKGGVKAGTYKVLVTKTAAVTSAPPDPKSADYKSMMMKASQQHGKSEVPQIYGDPRNSPLSLTIPPPSSPAKLELKSKP